jgi:hypothetical protein
LLLMLIFYRPNVVALQQEQLLLPKQRFHRCDVRIG